MRTARLSAVLVLLALMSTAASAQVTGVREVKLDNGLTVLMKESHAAPVFTAQVWFKVGSRNEHTGITGISHLLEHMLFNSSKNYKKGEISRLISERGGIENAATWTDFTYYWQLLAPDNLELSLKTLAERAGNALLLPAEFGKERTVVLSELEGRENDPDFLLYRDLEAAAYMAHPYQWPVIGWRSDVENVDYLHLRSYYQTYYHPNNATLVLVGDFDSKKALPLIKKYFDSSSPATAAPAIPRVYTVEPPQRGERRVTVRREGNAERVILAYHIPAISDPDTYPLMVLDQILSGGRSSRLYQALVEKQLATAAWSNSGSRKDPSLFMLGATTRQGVEAAALEKALLEQVEAAKSGPPSAEEMKSAKSQLEAYLIFQNDSVSDQGEQLGFYNTIASWRFLETLIPRIKAVTPEQVQAVAKKYFTRDNLTVGTFIPTGPAQPGAGTGAPPGPLHNSKWPAACNHGAAKPQASAGGSSRIRPYRTVLDNGMVLIVQENHSNPTVAFAGRTIAGSYFDPRGKTGTAKLTADMLERGTTARSALQLATEVESVGASIDTSASVEYVEFRGKALAKDFPRVLEVAADELRNPTFPQDQFERAKGESLSALEESRESTESQAFRMFYHTIFPEGHPYYRPTIDQAAAEIESITRDDLAAFHRAYYRPDTTILVIVGDIKPAEAVELAKKHFGDWRAEGPKPVMNIPSVPRQTEAKTVIIPMPDKSEVTAVMGYELGVKRRDPEFYTVRVMNEILGGSGALTSLLGEQVREKRGLVYDVYSSFDATLGGGPWYASFGTNPKNADTAIAVTRNTVEQFKRSGPTQEQLKRAQGFIIGAFAINLEDNLQLARTLGSVEFFGLGMDYLQDYPKYYRAVTLPQVKAAAAKYLHPETSTLVIAGPYKQK